MVRVTALTSPLLLGFDDLERALDKVAKAGTDGYPPYNIERIAANGDAPEKLPVSVTATITDIASRRSIRPFPFEQ